MFTFNIIMFLIKLCCAQLNSTDKIFRFISPNYNCAIGRSPSLKERECVDISVDGKHKDEEVTEQNSGRPARGFLKMCAAPLEL